VRWGGWNKYTNRIMKRSVEDIVPIETSHKAGMKRVLLAANESGCSITQIAITE